MSQFCRFFSFVWLLPLALVVSCPAFAETSLCRIAFEKKQYQTAFEGCREETSKNPYAQYALGAMYLEGLGVQKNPEQSMRWLMRAAENGVVDAEKLLGDVFSTGLAGGKNYPESIKWYERAAHKENTDAQATLGLMIANGRGVSKDLVKGAMWLDLASAQGHEGAKNSLDLLKQKMTQAEINSAANLVKSWRTNRQEKMK